MDAGRKFSELTELLRSMGSALIAFSGGVDSTLLLKAASLSGIKALAVTARSPIIPAFEIEDAIRRASEIGAEHLIIDTSEFEDEKFRGNPPERCYYCKDIRYKALNGMARKRAMEFVIDGANTDDLGDYRPGMTAAKERGVRSPLIEAGIGKADVREISLELVLELKPSSACLATRFPYGARLTAEGLRRVEEAEDFIRTLGFSEFRLRDHGDIARLELPAAELGGALIKRDVITGRLRGMGYKFVSLDLEGLKSGSMNRLI